MAERLIEQYSIFTKNEDQKLFMIQLTSVLKIYIPDARNSTVGNSYKTITLLSIK